MTESGSWFALKRFAVALGAVALGAASGMSFIPVVGSYVGMGLGGFAAGLAVEHRPLLECSLAGLLVGLGAVLVAKLGNGIVGAIIGLISMNPATLALSAGLSVGVAAVGAYYGHDFRDGLTRPVEDAGGRADGR